MFCPDYNGKLACASLYDEKQLIPFKQQLQLMSSDVTLRRLPITGVGLSQRPAKSHDPQCVQRCMTRVNDT